VHAVLAKCGIQVLMSDLFGVDGTRLLDRLRLPAPYPARIASLRRLIDDLDFEIDLFTGLARGRLVRDPGYVALRQIPGIGPVLAAVFVAEIGEVTRFTTAPQLACWAGLTPKHHESDTHVRRGRITKQGSRLVRWAAVESVQVCPVTRRWVGSGTGSPPGAAATSVPWPRPGDRSSTASTGCAMVTSAPCSPGPQHEPDPPMVLWSVASRAGHDPRPAHPGWRGRRF